LRSPLRRRPIEHSDHGRLEPTLPSVATNRQRYRRRSETHQPRTEPVDALPKPKPRDPAASCTRYTGGSCQPASGDARDVVRGTIRRSNDTPARYPQTTGTDPDRLSWGFVPYDAYRNRQRPTPGLPPPAVLRLQAFQPLDALFRLQPLRPCFVPVTPLGFRLQRFSLPGSELRLSTEPSLHAVMK
jgi:hypothetical protein